MEIFARVNPAGAKFKMAPNKLRAGPSVPLRFVLQYLFADVTSACAPIEIWIFYTQIQFKFRAHPPVIKLENYSCARRK